MDSPLPPGLFIIYFHQKLNCPIRDASDDQPNWREEGRRERDERVRDQRRGKHEKGTDEREGQRHE